MDLASKDAYIQKLASRVVSQKDQEPKKRPHDYFKAKSDTGPPKKKCKKKNSNEKGAHVKKHIPRSQRHNSAPTKVNVPKNINGSTTLQRKGGNVRSSFSTLDVLRKRLHEKIEESRGQQGAPKDAFSEDVQAKRAKRKLERERKKRKRKEFRMKELAEKNAKEEPPEIKQEPKPAPVANKRDETAILFNTVEMVDDRYVDSTQQKKLKKQSVKGKLTPLTGKNYKQLLSQVEARKTKLEQLREKDEGKAREMEKKMKWTNLLYKAEGIKIKDDENMLRTSLKKKEKQQAQRKKSWDSRCENVVQKMQQRQDKRKRNILKRKHAKADKRKDKARKKGRVLPEDLKKATV